MFTAKQIRAVFSKVKNAFMHSNIPINIGFHYKIKNKPIVHWKKKCVIHRINDIHIYIYVR